MRMLISFWTLLSIRVSWTFSLRRLSPDSASTSPRRFSSVRSRLPVDSSMGSIGATSTFSAAASARSSATAPGAEESLGLSPRPCPASATPVTIANPTASLTVCQIQGAILTLGCMEPRAPGSLPAGAWLGFALGPPSPATEYKDIADCPKCIGSAA